MSAIAALAVMVVAGGSVASSGNAMKEDIRQQAVPSWTWPLPAGASMPETIVVQGMKEDGRFKPQSAYLLGVETGNPRKRSYLPLIDNILPEASPRPFGQEARVEIGIEAGMTINCRAGEWPAGVVLSFDKALPSHAAVNIVVEGIVEAVRIALVRAGGDAGREEDVIGWLDRESRHIALPEGEGEPDAELVVVCPTVEARIEIASIALMPRRPVEKTTNATWIWTLGEWRSHPGTLLGRLREADIDDVAVQLPLGDKSELRALLPFLQALRRADIRLIAVEGDPAMLTGSGRENAMARARRLAEFLSTHPGLIESVQYDVEPYLLSAHAADPETSWRDWSNLMAQLHDSLGAPVSAVVPFWMIEEPSAQAALDRAVDHVDAFVVMAYRTDPVALEAIAVSWLERMAGMADIRIALEHGPLPVEYHRTYRRSDSGELVLVAKDGSCVVELYAEPLDPDGAGATYAFSHEVEANPARITFHGNPARLKEVSQELVGKLGAWTNFRGLAYHAFIEVSDR